LPNLKYIVAYSSHYYTV